MLLLLAGAVRCCDCSSVIYLIAAISVALHFCFFRQLSQPFQFCNHVMLLLATASDSG